MKKILKRTLIVFASIVATFIVVIVVGAWWELSHPPEYGAYNVEQKIVVFNPADSALTPQELYIQIPLNNVRQKAQLQDIKPESLDVVTAGNNRFKVRGFESVAPGEELEVVYSYKLKIRKTDKWRDQVVVSSDLLPEPEIESDNAMIRETAEGIVSGIDNPREKVRALFKYVFNEIDYAGIISSSSRSALECLKNKSGVCGHKANLLTALCRSVGIPARSIYGITLPISEKERFQYSITSHGWNEVFIEGEGWYFADPTNQFKLFFLSILYWDEYAINRACFGIGTNLSVFSTEIANLPPTVQPDQGMSGPSCFLFTSPKGSVTFHTIFNKCRSKAVRIDEEWEDM
ncbi:MAG: transglutaminase domain-containing protein [Candidatus Glassbacteria bacterium]|nr:transglutaminase domain-containing protein [Candidatus Glassbacteria bacterium]